MLGALNIHHFRNIESLCLTPHPRYNFFYGPNGCGKTSILESIYLLGTGHSFRTRETAPLVQQGQTVLTVFARTLAQDAVSIQKQVSGPTLVRLNQQPCQRSSELAVLLPCLVFYHDLFQIIDAGPVVRRSMIDWGLFHVEPRYHGLWKEYRNVLKQRNALLRQKNSNRQNYLPWETLLAELAELIHGLRHDYFQRWAAEFQEVLARLTNLSCQIRYEKGWDKRATGKSLASILAEQFEQDLQRQFTLSGPHHADMGFELPQLKARQHLSRGQQKIILIALKLAQASMLAKPCLYLMDDIAIELDTAHIERLFTTISDLRGQFFITSVQGLSDPTRHLQGMTVELPIILSRDITALASNSHN